MNNCDYAFDGSHEYIICKINSVAMSSLALYFRNSCVDGILTHLDTNTIADNTFDDIISKRPRVKFDNYMVTANRPKENSLRMIKKMAKILDGWCKMDAANCFCHNNGFGWCTLLNILSGTSALCANSKVSWSTRKLVLVKWDTVRFY